MQKVKGFTYDTERDKEVIDYIDRQGNGSKYIWSLVKKDMEENNVETIVRRILNEHLEKEKKNPPKLEG